MGPLTGGARDRVVRGSFEGFLLGASYGGSRSGDGVIGGRAVQMLKPQTTASRQR